MKAKVALAARLLDSPEVPKVCPWSRCGISHSSVIDGDEHDEL